MIMIKCDVKGCSVSVPEGVASTRHVIGKWHGPSRLPSGWRAVEFTETPSKEAVATYAAEKAKNVDHPFRPSPIFPLPDFDPAMFARQRTAHICSAHALPEIEPMPVGALFGQEDVCDLGGGFAQAPMARVVQS